MIIATIVGNIVREIRASSNLHTDSSRTPMAVCRFALAEYFHIDFILIIIPLGFLISTFDE